MSLLLAVWPLCRVRSDLQDFVVMLLRKMMYRQDVDGRWGMDLVNITCRGGVLSQCCHHVLLLCWQLHVVLLSWCCRKGACADVVGRRSG